MARRCTRTILATMVTTAGMALGAGAAPAETVVGLTDDDALVTFDSANPAGVSDAVPVTGLDGDEDLVGIDHRPSTGQLVGVARDAGGGDTVYRIDPVSGAATALNDLTVPLAGNAFGVDFNPLPDRLRITSSTGQNLRHNLAGTTIADTTLAYAGADPGFGSTPELAGAAYTNSVPSTGGATNTTALFYLDTGRDVLATTAAPNTGPITTVGSGLGVNAASAAGFDISPVTNAAFAVLTVGATAGLYAVDTTTGTATLAGALGAKAGDTLEDLAIVPSQPTLYAITDGAAQRLVSFRADAPGRIVDVGPVLGLPLGQRIVGFDRRPNGGLLYALTNAEAIFTIAPSTGQASPVDASAIGLTGTRVGVDFNPFADRLRVVSDTGQNLRLDPTAMPIATLVDTPLSGGTQTAAAYTNNVAGAPSTQLFDVDVAGDQLVLQSPPNAGTVTAVGSLGIGDVGAEASYDIVRTQPAPPAGVSFPIELGLAALDPDNDGDADSLYALDGSSTRGAAAAIGDIGGASGGVSGLTAAGENRIGLASGAVTVGEGEGSLVLAITRTGPDLGVSESVTVSTVAQAATGSDFGAPAPATVTFAAGETAKTVTVPIGSDTIFEGDETFRVELSAPSGTAVLGSPSATTVTIDEDDRPRERFTVHGLTADSRLVAFSSDQPGLISAPRAITGLAAGDVVEGIDVRPATGQLFGVARTGTTARVIRIDPVTGAATTIGATFALTGSSVGIDFNPVPDRLRVVSSSGANLRINPNNGAVTTDTTLAYAAGDPNAGDPPAAGAVAYTSSVPALNTPTSADNQTKLYDIDTDADVLAVQDPPNAGTLTTRAPLGIDAGAVAGFDISPRAAGGLALLGEGSSQRLYSVDLTSTSSALAAIGAVAVAGTTLTDIAIAGDAFLLAAIVEGSPQSVVTLRSDRPAATSTPQAISGLAAGETVEGIDTRPANGRLTALTSAGRLLTLDPFTGETSNPVTLTGATLSGTDFGVDFNPTVDRLRIVSDTGQNLRVNPDTGAVTTDAPLAAGAAVGAVAYSNNVAGAISTALFDVDSASDRLRLQSPPNNGVLTDIGSGLFGAGSALTGDITAVGGFDIAGPDDLGLAALTTGDTSSELYALNGSSARGQAALVGAIGESATVVSGLAALPADRVSFVASAVSVGEGGGSVTLAVVRTAAERRITVDVATSGGTAAAGADYTATTRTLTFDAGETAAFVTVPIADDASYEAGAETLTATLSNATGGALVGSPKTATVSIVENDAQPPVVVPGPPPPPPIVVPPPPPGSDKTAPRVTLLAPDVILARTLRASGLRLRLVCSEACTLSGTVRNSVLGRGTIGRFSGRITVAGGSKTVRVKLNAAARRTLLTRRRGSLGRLTIAVSARDAAGNTGSDSERARIARG